MLCHYARPSPRSAVVAHPCGLTYHNTCISFSCHTEFISRWQLRT